MGDMSDEESRAPVWPVRSPLMRVFLVGMLLILGVWGITAYRFSNEFERAGANDELIAGHYAKAQNALSAIRAAASQASGPGEADKNERQRAVYVELSRALREYVPIWDSPSERLIIDRLQHEIEAPNPASLLAISDELQSLNRAMFLEQQSERRAVTIRSEARLHQGLNVALLLSLVIGASAAGYSARLESRLERRRAAEVRYTSNLQRLSARVVAVQEEERRTIARELHDEVGQALAAIKVELAQLEGLNADARGADALARTRKIADDALRSVRDLSRLLHPPLLEELGLVHALEHQAKEFTRRHGVKVDLVVDGIAERLGEEMELAIYRIVQEALTNVAKHARARSCRVSLAARAGAIAVTVTDDGVGLPASARPGSPLPGDGLGLIGIRERAASLNGTVEISGDSGGVTLSVVLPVGEEVRHGRGASLVG